MFKVFEASHQGLDDSTRYLLSSAARYHRAPVSEARQSAFLVEERQRKVTKKRGNGYYSHAFTRASRYRGRKRMAVVVFREYIIKMETVVKSSERDGVRATESRRCNALLGCRGPFQTHGPEGSDIDINTNASRALWQLAGEGWLEASYEIAWRNRAGS